MSCVVMFFAGYAAALLSLLVFSYADCAPSPPTRLEKSDE